MFYKGQGFRFVLFIANQVPAFWIVIQTTCVLDRWLHVFKRSPITII